jgi:hypothetical protein
MEFGLRPIGARPTPRRELGMRKVKGGRWVAMEAGKRNISAKLFLCRGSVEGLLKKMNIERPTSNVEWEKIKKRKN